MLDSRRYSFDMMEEAFRRAEREAEAERARVHAEILARSELVEERASQLVQFVVDRCDRTSFLIVFNTETGQVGVATSKRARGRFANRSGTDHWTVLTRVRAAAAARLLHSGHRRHSHVASAGYRTKAGVTPYPGWLFDPTDEHARDWLPSARLFRHQSIVGRITRVGDVMARRVEDVSRLMMVLTVLSVVRFYARKLRNAKPALNPRGLALDDRLLR